MSNIIIRASAGSGKTFRLSNQFLQIVFQGHPVDTILASTFTRKAAGEILDRILQRLADAAADPQKHRELAQFLKLPDNLPKILCGLARNLYRLRICTLDSFFNKIASTFALELGLPPGWAILEETDFTRYLGEAVRNVLSESNRNDAGKLMNLLQKGEQDRNVTRELFDLASELLPIVRESTPENWNHEHLLQKELDDSELQQILERFGDAEIPKNKDGTKPKRFDQAREKIRTLAWNEEWKSVLEQQLIKNVVAGEFKFDKKEIGGELLRCLLELVKQAKAIQINKFVGQTKATRQLLDLIVKAYDEILFQKRGFRFDDVTERLGRNDFSPTLDSLAHRMDARTDHLLLDEFQDTSMPQWKVIRSFAEETSTKKNGSFFCVGDVKQAIYAWRGGVAGIFDTIQETVGNAVQESLNASFRSSPVIIETVNQLFGTIASNDALSKHSEAAQTWNARFEQHEAAKKELPGYCVLETAPSAGNSETTDSETEDEQDDDKIFVQYTVDRIAGLYRTRPGASIGVLVSRNKKIAPLIAGLKRQGIEASEEGGNPLTDSAAVLHILSAMTIADHPGDKIARFHLAKGPLAEILQLTDYRNNYQAVNCSLRLRQELINDGYGLVVERLAEQLAASCNPREFQRLEKLTELARRFQETASGVRTDRFIKMVHATKIESPTASPIRIMTVHKAKGLEFDLVVLPDLDVELVRKTPRIIVARKTPTSPIDFVIRYVGQELQPLLPKEYQAAFEKRIQNEVEESLSLLYVAVTRAKHELVMIVPPLRPTALTKLKNGEPTFSVTFSGILRAGLGPRQADSEPEILFQTGSKNWFKKSATPPQPVAKPDWLDCSLEKPPAQLRRNLLRVSPSGLENHQKPNSDQPINQTINQTINQNQSTDQPTPVVPAVSGSFGRNRDDALLWGTAMHTCFENGLRKNPWLDQGKPETEFLLQLIRSATIGKKGNINPQAVVDEFLKSCDKPNIRKTLSLSNYVAKNRTVEVEHERRFIVRCDDHRLLCASIDRLVILREGGKVIGLEIIDYKTDYCGANRDIAEFIAERLAVYTPQLEAYREGMSRLYRINPSAISAKLLFIEIDRVWKLS
ncbi:MAG: UvrD-helicase domain-containing protein [Planctomycetaceae bacterium]|nr:UvrD-helicase domain-containing protein [Planctomycetaceae bacterium]